MINIKLSPARGKEKTELSVKGSVLTLNNEEFDLSLLGNGQEAIHKDLGRVVRSGDDYELTVVIKHGKNAPESTRFPVSLELKSDYIHKYEAGDF